MYSYSAARVLVLTHTYRYCRPTCCSQRWCVIRCMGVSRGVGYFMLKVTCLTRAAVLFGDRLRTRGDDSHRGF